MMMMLMVVLLLIHCWQNVVESLADLAKEIPCQKKGKVLLDKVRFWSGGRFALVVGHRGVKGSVWQEWRKDGMIWKRVKMFFYVIRCFGVVQSIIFMFYTKMFDLLFCFTFKYLQSCNICNCNICKFKYLQSCNICNCNICKFKYLQSCNICNCNICKFKYLQYLKKIF